MRKLLQLTKVLLVAAGLGVGASAWAGTTTYDLYALAGSGYTTASWSSSYVSTTDGETAVNCYYMSVSNGTTVNDLDSRIAVSGNSSSGNPYMRSGYGYFYNTKNRTRYVAIPGLKNGDVVNIVFSKTSIVTITTVNDFVHSSGTISAGEAIESNVNYTVSTASATYDLFLKCVIPNEGSAGANNWYIKSVTITTTSENVSKPAIAITGSSEKTRQVTITAGASDAENSVTTYYTTDGSTPTTTSASFTSASKVITVGDGAESESTVTVKAITVSSTSVESDVASQDVTVGTKLQLVAPTITLSAFTQNGDAYSPTYSFTSDQSGVIGAPAVTYAYSFAGGDATEGTSYTATADGSITVTVSADGYTSNSSVMTLDGGYFYKSYSFNAIDDVTVDTSTGEWGNQTTVNGAQWTFTSLGNCTYTLRADMSLTGFMYARKTTGAVKNGFYARTGAGTVNFTLSSGEYILFTTLGSNVVANSDATSQSFAQYGNVRAMDIYTPLPATVSKSITAAGWATYCSPYALDFSSPIANLDAAYIVKGGDGSVLTKTEVTGTVPANTGLLLKGEGECVIPVVASGDAANVSGNKLVGVTAEYNLAADGGYVLLNDATNGIGFYKNPSAAFTVGANTAYLPSGFDSGSAPAFYSLFDNETTGVGATLVNSERVNNEIFNLQGQRVGQPTKGLYIVNGKKVVKK